MATRRHHKRFLVSEAITLGTRRKYLGAIKGFLDWAADLGEEPNNFTELDELGCDYIHHLYDTDRGRSTAAALLFGLKFYLPGAKRRLHQMTLALRGWERRHPSVSFPPLTWELCCAMAVKATKAGYELHGIAMLLQFDCLLRLSELLALRKEDIIFEGDPRYPRDFKGCLLCLRSTKTGRDQSVTVEDPNVLLLLQGICAKLPRADSPVFPFRADNYRRVFKRVAASLGLSARYVPHSCRHGGATRLFQRDPLSIEAIKLRGRWRSVESAKRYIQQGVVLLSTVSVPAAVARLGALFSDHVSDAIKAALPQQH